MTSAEVRRSTAQSRRWLTTAPGGPPATDSRLPAAGQYACALGSSRQRTRIWGRRAPQQHGRFECDERMGAPVISPVASLAHYCTCWTACNRLVAATSRTARSCGREQPPPHSHMRAEGSSAARPFRVQGAHEWANRQPSRVTSSLLHLLDRLQPIDGCQQPDSTLVRSTAAASAPAYGGGGHLSSTAVSSVTSAWVRQSSAQSRH